MNQTLQRKALEFLYVGRCTVIERQNVKDPITQITKQEEVPVLENQPCRLSFDRIASTNQTDTVGIVAQSTKLFIAPELDIKAGSKIVVTQRGRTTEYTRSGEPAIYSSHQEIQLELFERWA